MSNRLLHAAWTHRLREIDDRRVVRIHEGTLLRLHEAQVHSLYAANVRRVWSQVASGRLLTLFLALVHEPEEDREKDAGASVVKDDFPRHCCIVFLLQPSAVSSLDG